LVNNGYLLFSFCLMSFDLFALVIPRLLRLVVTNIASW